MKTNEHLYGTEIDVPEIPADIVMRRIELLKEHLAELLDHSYYTRDGKRCNDVMSAISFWEKINDGDK